QSIPVNVLDGKIRVLHIAGRLHPDVTQIRDVLSEISNVEVQTKTVINRNRFLESDDFPHSDSIDVVIAQFYPTYQITNSEIDQLIRQNPTIFISSSSEKPNALSELLDLPSPFERFNLNTFFLTETTQYPDHPIRDSLIFPTRLTVNINSS